MNPYPLSVLQRFCPLLSTMVQLLSLLAFVSSLLLVSATPVKRTLAKIQSDIARVDSLISTWDNSVNAFKGTSNQANAIHSAAVQLVTALNQATADTKATAILTTDMDALVLLGQMEDSSPTLLGGLTQITEKAKSFAGIRGATAVVEKDLRNLQSSTAALLTAVSAITPAEVVPQATQFSVTVNDAYADTLTDLAK
ncbi:hydrophobic surface binding protein A-domain-containing protein [Lentinula aciculospora]|uniref:Hydrophobic surface binding protein A-domain-containing protein n=1 Tax=Lentinula aciculospora TaxID=153920 RepID=A0A9W9AIM6_9AGAR|nr:hydrophobic surface binding protein A-domain-containing protein [Lentinula aciculospora]